MCFLSEDDLFDWITDEEIFSLYQLEEREKQVLHMHTAKGFTFKIIGSVFNISRQRAEQIHSDSVAKMRTQTPQLLRAYKRSRGNRNQDSQD